MTLLEHALRYVERGFEIFPCKPNKAPYTRNGMKDAVANTTQVKQWWQAHPDALIGCRIPRSLVVLDIDPRHGGDLTWTELNDWCGIELAVRREHFSGRGDGGFHAWFLRPEGKLSAKGLHDWAKAHGVGEAVGEHSWTSGIDLLHYDHRYTILPPSPHPDTGGPYYWGADELDETPLHLPPDVARLIVDSGPIAVAEPARPRISLENDSIADWYTANHRWTDILSRHGWTVVSGDGDSDGSKWRHPQASADSSATIRHGCLFVYTPNTDFPVTEDGDPRGITRFAAYAILEHRGNQSEAGRAARVARDGAQPARPAPRVPAEAPKPADDEPWPDPQPLRDGHERPSFPVDVLPDWIARHVRQVADEFQFPADLPAQVAITALSVACAGYAEVVVRGSWREPLNTYLVTAMPPGAGKSPAFRAMLGPLTDWEIELAERQAPLRDEIETKRAIIEKARTKAINAEDTSAALTYGDELRDLPVLYEPRLMADDATPEKVVDMLREQNERLAIVSTEGGLFSLMTGRYSDKSNLDVYLFGWSGDTIRVDRIGRAGGVVRKPHLTIGLTVQPSVIEELASQPELAGRGLTARFMYSMPPSNVGWRDMSRAPAIHDAVAADYARRLIGLAEHMRALPPDVMLEFEPEALTLFNEWRQDVERRRRPAADLHHMSEWTTKMESTVARLAGLLALAEGRQIDAGVMERALSVGRYWEAHARLAHEAWGSDPVVNRAVRIIDWALRTETSRLSLRNAYRDADRKMTPEDAVDAINLLVARGWLRSADDRPLEAGRRGVPSPEFDLHPDASSIRNNHVTPEVEEPSVSSHNRNNHVTLSPMALEANSDVSLTHSEYGESRRTRDMRDMRDMTPTKPTSTPTAPELVPAGAPAVDDDDDFGF